MHKIQNFLGWIFWGYKHNLVKFYKFPGEPGTIFSDLKHLLNFTGFKRSTYFGNTIIYKVEEEDGKILKISENAWTILHRNTWKRLCPFFSSKYLKETWTILDGSSPPATGHELSTARHYLRNMIVINCGINT